MNKDITFAWKNQWSFTEDNENDFALELQNEKLQ